MLETVDFKKKHLSKDKYKKRYEPLIQRLIVLQQQARSKGVGMVVLFEGWDGAGKGSRISDLMYNLDARATTVHNTADPSIGHDEFSGRANGVLDYQPLMAEFWQALGERGTITLFNRGWYWKAVCYAQERHGGKGRHKEFERAISTFERQIMADGYILVKFFVHMSAKGQVKRLTKLASNPDTAWRVSKADMESVQHYREDYKLCDAILESVATPDSPCVVLNGEDALQTNLDIVETLVNALEKRLSQADDPASAAAAAKAQANSEGAPEDEAAAVAEGADAPMGEGDDQALAQGDTEATKLALAQQAAEDASRCAPAASIYETLADYPRLEDVNYDLALPRDEYRKQLKKQQKRLFELQMKLYQARIPLVIMYEGQDAAGKGGNIKRLAQALDARSYTVFPSPSPTKTELAHPFLWRYWTRLPKAGHVGIYDRSWYGRVLVERVEGFASTAEWSRAYDEINEFERSLVDWGAILLKFWVEIDSDEQLARFRARQEDPNKQWKITEEDWRNRDKAPQYHAAVADMLRLTSTPAAPWHILESNDKCYARIKALKIINRAIEDRLGL